MEVWRIVVTIGRGILRRRKGLALLTFGMAALLLGSAAYLLSKEPPRFRTSATILLEARPEQVPLFQELSPFRPLPVQLAILNSRNLAEGVLESLPKASLQDLIENPYYVDYALEIRNTYRRLVGAAPEVESPQARALKELQRSRVKFTVEGTYGIVHMAGEATKPQVAIDLVNTYIEVLLSRTRTFNIDDARVSREFLEQQVADVKKGLDASDETIRAFTGRHGGVRVPEQSQATVTRLSQAENALAEVTASRRMIEARLRGLQEKLDQQKRNAPPATGSAPAAAAPRTVPPSIQRLRDQLAKLETALIDLRTRYTEEHPRVVLVKDQIAELQREIGSVVKETTSVTPAAGAVPPAERVNFGEQVVLLETSLHALSAQEDALRGQVTTLRQSLAGLSRSEMEYTRLTNETESNRRLFALLSDKLTASRIREQGEMKVVKVIDPPGLLAPATNEKRLRFGGVALLLAVALGGGVPGLVEWVKRPIETEEDVETTTGLPVLAVVPRLQSQRPLFLTARERKELGNAANLGDNFLFNEAFRNLRVGLQLAGRVDRLRSVMIASPLPAEGKSTVVVNLGLELGEAGRRVVLVDTDFLRPTLHQVLKVRQGGGLVDVLHAKRNVEESLVHVDEQVSLLARGMAPLRDTRGIMATDRLKTVLVDMSDQADFVLCDSSPVLLIPDNLFLAAAVDGVVLVVKAGVTGCRDLARAKLILEGVGARVLGVVINQMPVSRLRRYYRRYYKHYAEAPDATRKAS